MEWQREGRGRNEIGEQVTEEEEETELEEEEEEDDDEKEEDNDADSVDEESRAYDVEDKCLCFEGMMLTRHDVRPANEEEDEESMWLVVRIDAETEIVVTFRSCL